MKASDRAIQAVSVGILADDRRVGAEGEVNLWADSVGDAVSQLGLLLTLFFAARLAIGLLAGLAMAIR